MASNETEVLRNALDMLGWPYVTGYELGGRRIMQDTVTSFEDADGKTVVVEDEGDLGLEADLTAAQLLNCVLESVHSLDWLVGGGQVTDQQRERMTKSGLMAENMRLRDALAEAVRTATEFYNLGGTISDLHDLIGSARALGIEA